ncbi:MAG TPA: glycoside hydrolase family 38 C-terminal domain-containing protein [Planctomycetota bacterium]|nr:glycoside hydrolase family 38 C-terminal domain-containing protein [Planctomycetota bacterium]
MAKKTAKPAAKRRCLHLICGTHWDREWRYNYEQSLIRLTGLIDAAVEILEKHPEMGCFHLDGGTVMLEDYERVRPEMVARLRKLSRAGRIVTSPWFTLPEMFTVSGEAVVRNMAFGQRVAARFGALMRIGYTATGYGQLSQLPQLYAGFGISDILFYRGINKRVAPPLFWWEAPDGTRALDFRLFDDFARSNFYFRVYRRMLVGREPSQGDHREQPGRLFHIAGEETYLDEYRLLDAAPCAYSDEQLRAAVGDLLENARQIELVPGHLIGMQQEDNAVPSEALVRLIADVRRTNPNLEVRVESLADYVGFVRGRLGAAALRKLPVLRGEMRHSDREGFWGGLFANAVAARVDLKVANEAAENALERRAEPLSTLAWCAGEPHPTERLESAWKALLENHAHDSINGCSMDQVHKDMAYRSDKARLIAVELATRSMAALTAGMGHPLAKAGDHLLGVFNATGWERDGAVTCFVDLSTAGPTERFELVAPDGSVADAQFERCGPVKGRVHSAVVAGLRFNAARWRVTFMARKLPAVGWRTYLVRPVATVPMYDETRRDFRSQFCAPGAMENEHLRVEVRPDGSFDLVDKATGRRFERLNHFEDSGDIGSAWVAEPPRRDEVVRSLGGGARVVVEEDGALRTTLRTEVVLRVPVEAELDGSARSGELVDLPVTSRLTLRRGSRCVEIETEFENHARDHRLRAAFPTGLARAKTSTAAVPFDVVERPIAGPDSREWREAWYNTHPMGAFVDVCDGRAGLAVFTQGLREYEVADDPSRPLLVTLLRAQRSSMAVHSPETRAEIRRAGRYGLGRHTVKYAVAPHAGDWRAAELHRLAAEYRNSPEVVQFQPRGGRKLAAECRCLAWRPKELVLSALKKADGRDSVIVRLFNPTAKDLAAELDASGLGVKAAHLVRLDEERVAPLKVGAGGRIRLRVGHKKIVTLELVPGRRP